MKCPNCKEEVPDSAKVCGHCGNKLEAKKKTTKFCGECGAEVPITAKVCGECGAPFAVKGKAKAKPTKKKVAAKPAPEPVIEEAPAPELAAEPAPAAKPGKPAKEKGSDAVSVWLANFKVKQDQRAAQRKLAAEQKAAAPPKPKPVVKAKAAKPAKSAKPAPKAKAAKPRHGLEIVGIVLGAVVALVLIAVFLVVPSLSESYVLGQTYDTYTVEQSFSFDSYDDDAFYSENAFLGGGKMYLAGGDAVSQLVVDGIVRSKEGNSVLVLFRLRDLSDITESAFVGMYRGDWDTPNFRQWGVEKYYNRKFNTQMTGYIGSNKFLFNMDPYWDLKEGKWYYALFSFNSPFLVHAKVWEKGNPLAYSEQLLQFEKETTSKSWNFVFFIFGKGTVDIDELKVLSFGTLNSYVQQYKLVTR